MKRTVFVTGGTGYMGSALIPRLLERGHDVRMLARAGAERRVSAGAKTIIGSALDKTTFVEHIPPADTLVHLVGVAHPGPSKAKEFLSIDLEAVRASVDAAVEARVGHIVYLSVAHPSPLMKAYIDARVAGEELVRRSGLAATILRPWYVLGPGHRWPYCLAPVYWFAGLVPAFREGARRLGLVTLGEMTGALVHAVENPPQGVRILDVPAIKNLRTA